MNSSHVLFKPISYEIFLRSLVLINSYRIKKVVPESFFVNSIIKGKLIQIRAQEIIFISAALNYITIRLSNAEHLCYMSLKSIEEKLIDLPSFIRVHRSYVVNINRIDFVQFNTIFMEDKTQISIGKGFKDLFLKKIGKFTLKHD
ncbi:LytR/AlgR family response regulator transcription factor [Desertivirga xinjiangensis]|uniref:LytR/AlgR family response regulator transcription factor n=1 Tax=Desertivirga xinjiangensis TaxID=539206 RepID=UPI0034E1F42D